MRCSKNEDLRGILGDSKDQGPPPLSLYKPLPSPAKWTATYGDQSATAVSHSP